MGTFKRVIDPVLSTLASGYSNAAFAGSVLFPRVQLEKEGGKIPQFGKQAFKEYQTERALRAKSNRISLDGVDNISVSFSEHDIETPLDYREGDSEVGLPLQQNATNTVSDIIALRLELKTVKLATTPANYATTNKKALSGADLFSATTSDPIGVIEDAKDAIAGSIAKEPNTMVISRSVFKHLKNHPQLIERIKYSMQGVITLQHLKDIFEIENIVIAKALVADDKGVTSYAWGKNIVLSYVTQSAKDARSPYEPTFGYTFGKKGYPQIDTRNEDGKLQIVRSTDFFEPYITGADAGYLISNAIA